MSSLGNLLGGGKAESNDSLKYVAPREPKKGGSKPKPTPVNSTPTQEPTSSSEPAPAQTSKVLASAAIRLYQLNPQTNGYDAVSGGNPLGCVIVGMGLAYQILVYDGQKVPQATAAITSTFQYNLRDLYVSFGDTSGNNFSALFDTVQILTAFVRSLMAVVCHVNCHSPEAPQDTVKGQVPPAVVDSEPNAAVLAAGASAGCRFKAWEVCEHDYDNPSEVFASPPFLESSDVTKIKVGGGEDPVGGMGAALVGLMKNDKIIIGVPTGTAYTDCSGDLSLRKRPGVWVLIEIEIVKVKTEKKEKKKEKEKEKSMTVKPFSDTPAAEGTSSSDATTRSRSDSLSQRMASLAKQSGGIAVNIMSPSATPSKDQPASSSPTASTTSTEDFERQKKQQQEEFDRNMELQKREQEQELEKQKLDHERKQLELEKQRQQQHQQQIALVDGQEARSYYVPNDSAASYVRQQQQQQAAPPQPREDFSVHFTTLQQTILSLQTSVMGIHTKIDGLMTTKDSASNSDAGAATAGLLQQMQLMQQQQQMAAMYNPNAMYGGSPMPGMGGMNNQMNNMQMGGMNNQMGGMNNQMQSNQMQNQNQNQGPVARGTELINGVRALVDECAQHEQELVLSRQQGGGGSGGSGGISEQQIAKLEAKLEALMAKNDKLMDEKSELREKNSVLAETSAENSSKLGRVQREVESLKRQQEEDASELDSQKRSYVKRIAALNSEIETLTLEASSNRSAAKSGNNDNDEDKEKIRDLEQQLQNIIADKSKLQTDMSELEGIMMSSNREWQTRIDVLTTEKSDSLRQVKDQSRDELQEKEAAWEKEKLHLKVALADKERVVSDLEEAQSKTAQELSDARSSSNDSESANQAELEQQLSALRDEVNQLKAEKANDKERFVDMEQSLQTTSTEKENTQQRVEDLKKKIKEQDEVINDLGSSGSSNGDSRNPDELITDFVQDLFGRLHFAFVPPDNSSIDLDEAILSPNAVLKKCKKVLKQGATEFAAVPESTDRSTFVKLSR